MVDGATPTAAVKSFTAQSTVTDFSLPVESVFNFFLAVGGWSNTNRGGEVI
ncbi:MAG: hypothetical protein IPM38_13835 [Ignavibacteria bacterium]|nr:hypothetical protein [Ignavibacteria bacterium]